MTEVSDLVLVFPDPPPPLLVRTLDLAGQQWKAVGNAAVAMQGEPADGWMGAVVCAEDDPEGGVVFHFILPAAKTKEAE